MSTNGNDTIHVTSVDQSVYAGLGDDLVVLNAISRSYPRIASATIDGGLGTDTLDASNIFVGYSYMSISDNTFVDRENGLENYFSIGGFDFTDFEVIYGNASRANHYLLQNLHHSVTLHGGSADDRFVTTIAFADVMYGYGGNDEFSVRPHDMAFGGDGDDTFDLYATTGDLTDSFVDGGNGTDTLELSFGWTVDLRDGTANSPFGGDADTYLFENIENVVVYAWRGYESEVYGGGGRNLFSVDEVFNDGSVGVLFNGRAGNDTLIGSSGIDTLVGGSGNDTLEGREGNDSLSGDAGNDRLLGDAGDDSLTGGLGDDTLDGGTGNDSVFFTSSSGIARISGTFEWLEVVSDEGTDIVNRSVETLIFSDQTYSFAEAVALAQLPAEGNVIVLGSTQQGATLSADISGVSDPNTMGVVSYQWLQSGIEIGGASGASYVTTQADVGHQITVRISFVDGLGGDETLASAGTLPIVNVNDAPTGAPLISGATLVGQELTVDTLGIADLDGLGAFIIRWQRDGGDIPGANGTGYTLTPDDLGARMRVVVTYTDLGGTTEEIAGPITDRVAFERLNLAGDAGSNLLEGGGGDDALFGLGGDDTLRGEGGNDALNGGDGADILVGGDGADSIIGGETAADLRDVVYGGEGDDSIDGGYGNDELRGDAGNDTILGGFGADTVIGGDGDDNLTSQAYGDEIFGGAGADFINGGFGHDRVNGGADADRFFHLGVADHGSDWIQDYNAADGDVLQFGAAGTRDQFQVNFTETASAGTAGVEEAFVIYRPTGQILWALVDGQAQSEINLLMGGVTYDLLA